MRTITNIEVEAKMRATIHYNGDYEDTLTIEADSLNDLKKLRTRNVKSYVVGKKNIAGERLRND